MATFTDGITITGGITIIGGGPAFTDGVHIGTASNTTTGIKLFITTQHQINYLVSVVVFQQCVWVALQMAMK